VAKRTFLEISAQTTAGKLYKESISYINPAASNAVCNGFVEQMFNLSNDTYVDADRIDKESVKDATETTVAEV